MDKMDYAHDLSFFDKKVSKMPEFLEFLRAQGVWIGFKIDVKKNKSLRLGITNIEEVILGNEEIDQVDSFI